MISFFDIERLLEKHIGDIEPEMRQLARGLMEIFDDLEEDLLAPLPVTSRTPPAISTSLSSVVRRPPLLRNLSAPWSVGSVAR
jgi:hypothetical protein